ATVSPVRHALGAARPAGGRPADAMQLPFDDASFDMVVCQFGVMFFPDRAAAYAEAPRVLRPGGHFVLHAGARRCVRPVGHFVFNAWDRIEENEFADVVTTSVGGVFPDDPPRFLARV